MANANGAMYLYGNGSICLYPSIDDSVYGAELLVTSTTNVQLRPTSSAAGVITLGADARRFKTAYLSTAASVSSDRNIKTEIQPIDERYVELFDKLEPVSYKLIGATHDRDHLGFISQDVKAAMDEVGISDLEFGGYCRDAKLDPETENPILDENGDPVYSYSLRYGEFIALNSKMIQLNRATIVKQEQRIERLEQELENLKRLLEKST